MNYYSKTFNIRISDVNSQNHLKITSFFDFLQDIAFQHAKELGFGFHALTKSEWFWILSRIKLKIHKYPKYGEKIIVKTKPTGFKKIFAIRDFLILDKNDHVIAESTSYWLMVNSKTKKIIRPDKVDLPYNLENSDNSMNLKKIKFQESLAKKSEYCILNSDIDFNQHTNNVSYIKMVEEEISKKKKKVSEFQINFLNESFLDDKVKISTNENKEIFCGKISEKEIFKAKIKYQDKVIYGKFFSKEEFNCSCCGKSNISPKFLEKLITARKIANIPFTITSACRCKIHNKKVGGVENSSHIFDDNKKCCAVDIKISNSNQRFIILNSLMKAGFSRFGIATNFLHVDSDPDKPQNLIWKY